MTPPGNDEPVARARSQRSIGLAAILAALSMLSPFSIDTFFPSMRAMQGEFGIDSLTVQQLLTAYMVPYAAMSLVHGALSDALGRRAVVLAGMSLYLLVSVGCMFAPNFHAILAYRAVQGLTAGVGITVGRAIIRDLYEGREAQRLMSAVTMIFGVAPAIAPIVGGWIHVGFGWRGVFGFLGLVSLVLLALTWRALPETHPAEARRPWSPADLARTSASILVHPSFFWLALCNGVLFGTIWIYIGSAPAIVVDAWGKGETDFGALFLPLIGGYVLGALLSGRMAGRVQALTQLKASLLITLLGGLLATPVGFFRPDWIATQQAAMAITALGVQIGAPVLTLRALDLFPTARGSVSSLLAFVQLVWAAITLGVAPLVGQGTGPIALYSLGTAMLAALCANRAMTQRLPTRGS